MKSIIKFHLFSALDRRISVSTALDVIQSAENLNKIFDMKCDVCPMELSSLQHAKLHYLDEHGNDNGYIKCCGEEFRKLKDVKDHLLYHYNPDIFRYVTNSVGFALYMRLLLTTSIFVFSIDICRCSICDRKFKRMATLSGHISRHRALDAEIFKCDKCDRVCTNNFQLMRHKKVHSQPNQRLPCNQCERK